MAFGDGRIETQLMEEQFPTPNDIHITHKDLAKTVMVAVLN